MPQLHTGEVPAFAAGANVRPGPLGTGPHGCDMVGWRWGATERRPEWSRGCRHAGHPDIARPSAVDSGGDRRTAPPGYSHSARRRTVARWTSVAGRRRPPPYAEGPRRTTSILPVPRHIPGSLDGSHSVRLRGHHVRRRSPAAATIRRRSHPSAGRGLRQPPAVVAGPCTHDRGTLRVRHLGPGVSERGTLRDRRWDRRCTASVNRRETGERKKSARAGEDTDHGTWRRRRRPPRAGGSGLAVVGPRTYEIS